MNNTKSSLLFKAEFMDSIPERAEEALEFLKEHGRWPHQYSRCNGFDFETQVKEGNLFKPFGGQFVKRTRMQIYEHLPPAPSNDPDPDKRVNGFNHTVYPGVIPMHPINIGECMKRLYDSYVQNSSMVHFTGILQRGDEALFPFFLDFDEVTANAGDFAKTDEFVETCIGPLLEVLYPNCEWWWIRAEQVREEVKEVKNEERKLIEDVKTGKFKGGVHVHVKAFTSKTIAEAVFKFIKAMVHDVLEEMTWITMDPVTFSKTGVRPNGAYKSRRHNRAIGKNGRNNFNCSPGCTCADPENALLVSNEELIAPPYWIRPEFDTYERFLYSSIFEPERCKYTPINPSWKHLFPKFGVKLTQREMSEMNAIAKTATDSWKGLKTEDGKTLKKIDVPVQKYKLCLDWIRAHGEHGSKVEIKSIYHHMETSVDKIRGRPTPVFYACLDTHGCVLQTRAKYEKDNPGKLWKANHNTVRYLHNHTTNYNYYVFAQNGNVYIKCRSDKDENKDICRRVQEPLPVRLTETEIGILFDDELKAFYLHQQNATEETLKTLQKVDGAIDTVVEECSEKTIMRYKNKKREYEDDDEFMQHGKKAKNNPLKPPPSRISQ